MKRIPWVTGPAVEIIVKFGGLQVGDEVKFKRCDDPYHQHPDDRSHTRFIYRVVGFADDTMWIDLERVSRTYVVWCICPCSVTHWRRPKKVTP